MLFNSLDFAFFLPIVFVLYWWVAQWGLRAGNLLLLLASYVFYGWWDWRFLGLILFSTVVDYAVGRALGRTGPPKKRKVLLAASLIANLGLLAYFKYANFFVAQFAAAFSLFGQPVEGWSLSVILPVGISFYTFQTLSYTIDVYRRRLPPTSDFWAFAAYVSFFPQLVAGPIERAAQLLPQFLTCRRFHPAAATDGMRQILWGLFKKMVIADNCAVFADMMFNDPTAFSGSALLIGAFFFAIQIYGDFSGYSDIAIGTARLFGFRLMQNFAFPYFSRSIPEFWRRWHISLSTWFRDYVYVPLGGSRVLLGRQIRNVFIVFMVSGFWHGANWTFIVWGVIHALCYLPSLLRGRNRTHLDTVASGRTLPSIRESLQMIGTFTIVVLAWVCFRSPDMAHAWVYWSGIFSPSLFAIPDFYYGRKAVALLMCIPLFLIVEWQGRHQQYAIERLAIHLPRALRWSVYSIIILLIGLFMEMGETPFIYFQF